MPAVGEETRFTRAEEKFGGLPKLPVDLEPVSRTHLTAAQHRIGGFLIRTRSCLLTLSSPARLVFSQGVIPGLGEVSLAKLAAAPFNINSCDRLFAVYFNHEREKQPTIDYLTEKVGIQKHFARAAVNAIEKKLSRDVL